MVVRIGLLFQVSRWYAAHRTANAGRQPAAAAAPSPRRVVLGAIAVLLLPLIFSKYF